VTSTNQGYVYVDVIDGRWTGSLLQHLCTHHQHSSEQQWLARIVDGEVRIDGDVVRDGAVLLRAGQRVAWHKPPWVEPPAPLDVRVVFDDDDLLVVDKPAGLPTLPGAGYLEHTLLHVVRSWCANNATVSPIHRLDRGTSGLVLFARHTNAARTLQQQADSGLIDKRYHALVQGVVVEDEQRVQVPIGMVDDAVVTALAAAHPAGKPACSVLRVVKRGATSTLLEVQLLTGRAHQIRIHCAAIGHPLVGEPLYGAGGVRAVGSVARPGDDGFVLRAQQLTLLHPRHGERVTFSAGPITST
jgi:23S rRNA pseudouridine1911/1915/1917 synthase